MFIDPDFRIHQFQGPTLGWGENRRNNPAMPQVLHLADSAQIIIAVAVLISALGQAAAKVIIALHLRRRPEPGLLMQRGAIDVVERAKVQKSNDNPR